MKERILFLFLMISAVTFSQNVGINATGAAPVVSAMLDVAATNKGLLIPNVNLTSNTDAATIPTPAAGLLVYNTNAALPCGAGYYYNSGTTVSPAWLCFKKQQQVFQMYGTSPRTNINSTAHVAQPGLSTTIIVPPGQTAAVSVIGDIGIRNISTTAGAYSIVDVIIYLNGTFLPQGGWNRYETANSGTVNQNAFGVVPLSATFTLAAGTHTIVIRSARFGGTTNVDIGGNCVTDTNCGEFTVFVNYQ
ncbi:MAG: hypothetical protein Q7W45_07235 [Bacteroidota bacterium]|nr:hypothetical protein [Bacteroidota bacterium]MDP3143934.1 hypothetical protein [Bacteroidota bacterium]MDP3557567.1 hypothetical protein [Bacteroidota bacterium]